MPNFDLNGFYCKVGDPVSFYLCIENGDQFIIEASDLATATEDAELYGGSVIRKLTIKEVKEVKEKGHTGG